MDLEIGIRQTAVIEIHHLHDVQQLALVCMEALDLDIEDGVRVNDEPALAFDVLRETNLVRALGGADALEEGGITFEVGELFKFGGVIEPGIADRLADEFRVGGVCFGEEAAVADTIGLVVEYRGLEGGKILERARLEDIGVDLRHAVDRVAADDRKVGHTHLSVPQDGGGTQALCAFRLRHVKTFAPTTIDLIDDLVDARQ